MRKADVVPIRTEDKECISDPETKYEMALDVSRATRFTSAQYEQCHRGSLYGIKTKMRIHSGISKQHRIALIQYIARMH